MFPNGGPGVGVGEADGLGAGLGGAGDGGKGEAVGLAALAWPVAKDAATQQINATSNGRVFNSEILLVNALAARATAILRALLKEVSKRDDLVRRNGCMMRAIERDVHMNRIPLRPSDHGAHHDERHDRERNRPAAQSSRPGWPSPGRRA
jgi:hypothetical protein